MLNDNIHHTLGIYVMSMQGQKKLRFLTVSHEGSGNMFASYARSHGVLALLATPQGRSGELKVHDYAGDVSGGLSGLLGSLKEVPREVQALSRNGGIFRVFGKVSAYFKDFFPTVQINPIFLRDGIVYDAPYLFVNGTVACKFMPVFGQMTPDVCRFENGVFAYERNKTGYILEEGFKRHTAVTLSEKLYVNLGTGRVTCSYSDVVDGQRYFKEFAEFNHNIMSWQDLEVVRKVILGYKSV